MLIFRFGARPAVGSGGSVPPALAGTVRFGRYLQRNRGECPSIGSDSDSVEGRAVGWKRIQCSKGAAESQRPVHRRLGSGACMLLDLADRASLCRFWYSLGVVEGLQGVTAFISAGVRCPEAHVAKLPVAVSAFAGTLGPSSSRRVPFLFGRLESLQD